MGTVIGLSYGLAQSNGECAEQMSYNFGCGVKQFLNKLEPRANLGSEQNSYATIMAATGFNDDLFIGGFELRDQPRSGPAP